MSHLKSVSPPEPMLEWAMLFDSGRPASAILRTSDMREVQAWAAGWPGTVKLHRRLEGNWFPHDRVAHVELVKGGAA